MPKSLDIRRCKVSMIKLLNSIQNDVHLKMQGHPNQVSDYFLIGILDKALKQTSNQDKAIGDMYSKDLRARETLTILFLFLVYIIYILGTNR